MNRIAAGRCKSCPGNREPAKVCGRKPCKDAETPPEGPAPCWETTSHGAEGRLQESGGRETGSVGKRSHIVVDV